MKMNGRIFYKASLIGIINGILLGVMMKWAEMVSGKQVYQLLLNVDFLPLIGAVSWSEASLFFFHLLFSLAITFSYAYILHPLKIFRKWNKYALAFITIIPPSYFTFHYQRCRKQELSFLLI
ncbi:hypothetical protein J7E52_24095 [Bacillus sp. ISL-34]|uniref:hypothetical protein n=1 Tax=Bacillus sp. ISL-34 TaxID=2819121 RepID=UPI001BE96A2C|nr:hypothetical protein [Bacillus sp. ISL-34]MBT2649753.1 hypothetical protein [Bacillus sp. ISL-34]